MCCGEVSIEVGIIYRLWKMARKLNVKGYEEFQRVMTTLEKDSTKKLIVYFTGDRNENGLSWCPDCVNADSWINRALDKYLKPDIVFLTVEVGDKTTWKGSSNPFRVDPNIKINVIPTMVFWGGVERLHNDQCANMNLLDLFFSEISTNANVPTI